MNRNNSTNNTIQQLNKEYPHYEWYESRKQFWKPCNYGDRITGFITDIREYKGNDYSIALFTELKKDGITWRIPLKGENGAKLIAENKYEPLTIEYEQGNQFKIYNARTKTEKTTTGRITL